MTLRSRKPAFRPDALVLLLGAFVCSIGVRGAEGRAADPGLVGHHLDVRRAGRLLPRDHAAGRRAGPGDRHLDLLRDAHQALRRDARLPHGRGILRDARRDAAPRNLFPVRRDGRRVGGESPGRQGGRDHAHRRDDARQRNRLGPGGDRARGPVAQAARVRLPGRQAAHVQALPARTPESRHGDDHDRGPRDGDDRGQAARALQGRVGDGRAAGRRDARLVRREGRHAQERDGHHRRRRDASAPRARRR